MNPVLQEAIEAVIQYLEALKTRGVVKVRVSESFLQAWVSHMVRETERKDYEENTLRLERAEVTPTPAPPKSQGDFESSVKGPKLQKQNVSEFIPLLRYQSIPMLGFDATGGVGYNVEEKRKAIAQLREQVLLCTKCPHLAKTRKNVVFGVGDIDASLMFVGEAPCVEEDEQGEPFVGKAGQLLTKIIQTMGLSRERVYIANVLKCRPDTPPGMPGNRKPTFEEMRTCVPYLEQQILLIRPKVIVALGATAVEGLFNKRNIQITKIRGHWLEWNGIPVMPTYHPSYLLRNPSISAKREVWEDMLKVMEMLGIPISEKQRNYFKK